MKIKKMFGKEKVISELKKLKKMEEVKKNGSRTLVGILYGKAGIKDIICEPSSFFGERVNILFKKNRIYIEINPIFPYVEIELVELLNFLDKFSILEKIKS